MANIKSAIKRNRQNEKRRVLNRTYRGGARTYVRKAFAAMEAGDKEAAETATLQAVKALDKAAQKGVVHKNNAARRKSRLVKRLAAMD
ncbi:MAG: 30S ribosomal protein S20 [Anaerolineaceae bacterium]|nr:30S ribosomal protein S20 [Anaerolineaceae bacterium]